MNWKVLNTVPGAHAVVSSQLAYVTPLKVKCEGSGYDIVRSLTTPGNRQVSYFPGLGGFDFGSFIFPPGAKVYVLYN